MTTQTQSFPDIETKQIEVLAFRWDHTEKERDEFSQKAEQIFTHYAFSSADTFTYWNLTALVVQWEFAVKFAYDPESKWHQRWPMDRYHTVTLNFITSESMLDTIFKLRNGLNQKYAVSRDDGDKLHIAVWNLLVHDLDHLGATSRAPESCGGLQ